MVRGGKHYFFQKEVVVPDFFIGLPAAGMETRKIQFIINGRRTLSSLLQ
jgi:hypothetical protein